ncbi:Dabb family protein [Roseibaca sp. V10]|uniref:Dabb family protein n=1 Tax=Roseinatronobacter domitianus TaxID=2940293 RepID=A0ABT0M081_9RHOB|nr:Dabb family protein [Roseibaca domitiana]MCL1628278.1 Dabb family protein [Roseibaca domitiana]
MIRHIVLTRFKPDVSEAEITALYAELSAVIAKHPGARGFISGRSASPEQMEQGYHHGFTIDFDDWAALEAYAKDPAHRALGARLVGSAIAGRDGLIVLDIAM